jgi:hypothetical protein
MKGYSIRLHNNNIIYSKRFSLRHRDDKSIILKKQVQLICNELTESKAIEQIENKIKLEIKENYYNYELI